MSENDEILEEFIAESRDMLDDVEPRLIELNDIVDTTGAVDQDTIGMIFRLFHSMKGSANFLQLVVVSTVTHEAETLLDRFRKNSLTMNSVHTDLLCRTCDLLNELLNLVEENGTDVGVEDKAESIKKELIVIHSSASSATEEEDESAQESGAAAAEAEIDDLLSGILDDALSSQEEPSQKEMTGEEKAEAEIDEMLYDISSFVTPEMIEKFVQESDEQIRDVEEYLLLLEADPKDIDSLDAAFRLIHSVKGNCGFMGCDDLGTISHRMEEILEAVREGSITNIEKTFQTLLSAIDLLNTGIVSLSEGGNGSIPKASEMLAKLDALLKEIKDVATAEKIPEPEAVVAQPKNKAKVTPEVVEKKKKDAPPATAAPPKRVQRRDIRVDLSKLDVLNNLVGELVIAASTVVHNPDLQDKEFENFERSSQQMMKIIADLRDVAMAVRMTPVAATFRKMIRLVHDVSSKVGKKITLTMAGEDTEVDKTVSELIADPLVHIIRNSVDHGIETPEERAKTDKDEVGVINIEARHEGGEVWITIKDDGKGLDRDRILGLGIERGLVDGDGSDMRDEEIFKLIFEPGFSTAKEVTDVSGRGVGMDVVRKNIEQLKGSVEVRSRLGEGTVVLLRIPLTLAIIEGMLVRVGSSQYIIPILAIRESLRVRPEMVTKTMDGDEVVRVRDEMISVLRLHNYYNVKTDVTDLTEGILLILEYQGQTLGLFVDRILGQSQAVIKGLSEYLDVVRGISGCTILGDGEVSLILDVGSLIRGIDKKEQA